MSPPQNTPERLRRRAQLAVLAAASAVTASAHIAQALHNAEHGRLDNAVLSDLNACIKAIERTVRHAELCRQRLLRKAERKETIA